MCFFGDSCQHSPNGGKRGEPLRGGVFGGGSGCRLDTPGRHKSILIWRNKMVKKTFEPISQYFGDGLIDNIA